MAGLLPPEGQPDDNAANANPPELVGTGRHLTATELRAWTSLLDASRILDTQLETDLLAHHEMSHREYEVLVRLDGWGGSLRMADLARQIEASGPLVSQTVSRLEDRGWVGRRRNEHDGRGVDAVLLPPGRDALAAAAEPHAEIVSALLLEQLGDQLPVVAEALGRVADHLRQHRAGMGCEFENCPMTTDQPG